MPLLVMALVLFAACKPKVVADPKPLALTGSNWTEVGNHSYESVNPLTGLFIDSAGNVFAAGNKYQTSIGGFNYSVDYVAKWDGFNWQQLGTGANALNANAGISTICKDNAGNIYAGGGFTDSTFVSSYWCHPEGYAYVAKWDGVKWLNLGGRGSLPVQGIYSVVFNPINGYLYAAIVGSYTYPTSCDIYFFNGSVWAPVSSNKLNGNIYQLYVNKNGDLYAAGNVTNAAGKYYVARWNGTNWTEPGAGGNELNANGNIRTVCGDALGNIYAAGGFTNANGNYYVAKWDGTRWTELGGLNALGGNGAILSVCADGAGNLYAAGAMNYKIDAFDVCYYVAKWNGSSWTMLGKNTLFASGGFTQLGVNASGTVYAVGSFTNAAHNYYVGSYP